VKRKENIPPQCLVWFRLNGLGSSQNDQNRLIHNWCVGGCWFTQAKSLSQGLDIWVCVCVDQLGTDFYYLPNTGVCRINGVLLLTAKLPLFHSRAC
jgi:hypothetical protein